jgi:hypothetical protein
MSMTRAPRRNAVVAPQAPSATQQEQRPLPAKDRPEPALGAAVANREVLGAGGVLALQAAAGNRAVTGLVQAKRGQPSTNDSARVHEAAKLGIGGTSGELPHLETIQRSFGRHDVTGVAAHTGAQATAGAQAMGAAAFTMGNHVAFAGSADLRTAAHEAAHVVQQRAGVQLAGGVGQVGDRHERHADAVAEDVVQGRSAEAALDRYAGDPAGSRVQRTSSGGSSGSAPVQAMWPFDGPSIFSSEFWQGSGAQQPAQQPAPPPAARLSVAEIRRREQAASRQAARDRRRQAQQRLDTLAPLLRNRLIAVETQLSDAANSLPARVRVPWDAQEPDAVEGRVRPAIQALPGAGHGQFRFERDADEAEARTVELERYGNAYASYCAQIRATLVPASQYFTTFAATLGHDLTGRFDAASRSIASMAVPSAGVIQRFQQLLAEAQQATAVDSLTLYNQMVATPAAAQARVHQYFQMGRLRIGHNRSFYASEFDAPAGSFGGEWALVAVDHNLADIAGKWVYHTHCAATGAPSTQDFTGFTIRRGFGASHIKRIADRMAAGVSITVDYPPEFDRIEHQDQQRFLSWVSKPEGAAAIKRQKRK